MKGEKIFIGSDHGGFELKGSVVKYLKSKGIEVHDAGPKTYNHADDYPDYALKVCKLVLKNKAKGILICNSGQGMDRAANKVRGIYASVAWNKESAIYASEHAKVNVLCLAGKLTKPAQARQILDIWLAQPSKLEGRHQRRLNKIKSIEHSYMRR